MSAITWYAVCAVALFGFFALLGYALAKACDKPRPHATPDWLERFYGVEGSPGCTDSDEDDSDATGASTSARKRL